MISKIILSLLAMLLSAQSQAGVVLLTIHSRANCGNNESISWDMRWYRVYDTVSDHFRGGGVHEINTGWENTWRSAAVHWGEAAPGSGWKVIGAHWMKDPGNGQAIFLGKTDVIDCSIYNGWWDH